MPIRRYEATSCLSLDTVKAIVDAAEQVCAVGRGPGDEERTTNGTSVDGPFDWWSFTARGSCIVVHSQTPSEIRQHR